MPHRGAMGEHGLGREEDLAAANASEYGDDGHDLLLSRLVEDIAGAAEDPEEAAAMCRDLANAEDLDAARLARLVRLVEDATGWDLPEGSEAF